MHIVQLDDLKINLLDTEEAERAKEIRLIEESRIEDILSREIIRREGVQMNGKTLYIAVKNFTNDANLYPLERCAESAEGYRLQLDILIENVSDCFTLPYVTGALLLEVYTRYEPEIRAKGPRWKEQVKYSVERYQEVEQYFKKAMELFPNFRSSVGDPCVDAYMTNIKSYVARVLVQRSGLITLVDGYEAAVLAQQAKEQLEFLFEKDVFLDEQAIQSTLLSYSNTFLYIHPKQGFEKPLAYLTAATEKFGNHPAVDWAIRCIKSDTEQNS